MTRPTAEIGAWLALVLAGALVAATGLAQTTSATSTPVDPASAAAGMGGLPSAVGGAAQVDSNVGGAAGSETAGAPATVTLKRSVRQAVSKPPAPRPHFFRLNSATPTSRSKDNCSSNAFPMKAPSCWSFIR